jgi:hypothetical protein
VRGLGRWAGLIQRSPYLDESTPPSGYLPTKRAQYKVFHNDGVDTVSIDQILVKWKNRNHRIVFQVQLPDNIEKFLATGLISGCNN